MAQKHQDLTSRQWLDRIGLSSDHRTLWRTDFTTVPAAERRAARYALQLARDDARLRHELKDSDVLAALWELTLPLLDPDAVAALLSLYADAERHWMPPGAVDWEAWDDVQGARRLDDEIARRANDGREEVPSPPLGAEELRERLRSFFRTLPRWVLRRLAQADAAAPTSATIALLGEVLALDATAVRLLDFLEQRELVEPLRLLLRAHGRTSYRLAARINRGRMAALLGLELATTQSALARCAPLRALGLVDCHDGLSDLEDFLAPTGLLREVLEAAPRDTEALLGLLIEPAPAAAWSLDAFPQLAEAATRLQGVLRHSAATAADGVNALFYGPPGTGKTELARALAAACGLRAYQVRSADEDGDGLRRTGRLSAYLLAQCLLGRRRDAVILFDEIDDILAAEDQFALQRGSRPTGRHKGWMNRILEENPVPAIWITNDADSMDPAFLRRFLLPVAFVTPPRSVRRRMVESHLGDCDLPPTLLDELAADAVLTPAQWGAARRLLDLHPQAPAEQTVRDGIAAVRTLLYGAPTPRRRTPATRFDVAFLNLAGGIGPSAIARALAEQGRGSLCFYGPPGTGKTAFAEVLAEALDRELVARQASDLISPYVGETEQNLARLFRECDPVHSVLLLDEVDSYLADRRAARHSWERTQVNELLQQMERYPGIFIAATNLMAGIDAAALRRFDFKLHFRALTQAQRLALFAREALGDATAAVPPDLARHLEGLSGLTAGDFATVCRQRHLLWEVLTPEQFLRRLAAECRLKQVDGREAA